MFAVPRLATETYRERHEEVEMDPEEHEDGALPALLVVVASVADAAVLAPLASPAGSGPLDHAVPQLVATGPEPMDVDAALDDLETPAARTLLLDGPCDGPVEETARLLPRLDALIAESRPAAVVLRGGSTAGLAAAQAAVCREVPVVHVAVDGERGLASAHQAAVAELAAWQTSPEGGMPYPAQVDLMVHRRLGDAAGTVVHIPGDRRTAAPATPSGLSA